MNSKKNKMGSNQELYRICPSQLTKHELEDLYFTVLETNIKLRKTINEQQERIKTLCNKTQRKTSALKVLQAEERKNCCVFTNIKVKQQKESLDNLRRAHEKTAERVRKLNTQVCSTNHNSRLFSPYCAQNTSSKCIKNITSTAKHLCNSAQMSAQAEETHTTNTAKHQCHSTHMDAQTYEKNNKLFHSVGTQTELPRDAILQHKHAQTELLKDGRLRSVDAQTNPPRSKTYHSAGTQTDPLRDKLQPAEIQTELQTENVQATVKTENSSEQDSSSVNTVQTQTESLKHKTSLVSVETQSDSKSKTPYKYHEKEGQKDTLCDENRCRTLMDELKLKITYLVEELAQTHKKYSDRISRLEVGVQEYHKEYTQVDRKRMVEGQEVSLPSESYWNKLVNNLRNSAAYSADLEVQLANEKKKVSELISQLRLSQLHNHLTQEHQLINKKRMVSSEDTEDYAQQEGNSWTCNCNPNCPNNQCPFRNKPSYKHQCTSKCYSENTTPANSSISSNTSEKYNYDDRKSNDIVDSHKDQGLSIARKSQKISDIDNGEYQTNTEKNKNMTNNSKRIPNGNNRNDITVPPPVEPHILEETKNRDFTSSETFPGGIGNYSYNVNIEDETGALPAANRMQTLPATDVRNSVDMSHNRTKAMFDFNETNEISDYIENENNDRDNTHEFQNVIATHRSKRNTKDFTEVNDNQSKDLKKNGKKMSLEKADINKVNEKTNTNGSLNSVDANKQQFLSKRRSVSVSSNAYQNRNVASPSFLVKLPHVLEDTKNRDFTSSETSHGGIKNYNVDIEDKTGALPAANRMQTVPATDVKNSVDMSHNRTKDMSDFNKTNEISDYIENENNDRGNTHESQNGIATDRSERNPKDFTEVNDSQSKDLKMDGKKISLEKADINKVNEKTNANGSRNSVDANKQQFLSKRRSVSVSSNAYQNRNVASPSFLVKLPHVLEDTKNRDFTSAETSHGGIKNYNVDIEDKTGALPAAHRMQTVPATDVRNSVDMSHNRTKDMFDFNKTNEISDYIENENNDRDNTHESQNGTSTDRSERNPKDFIEVNDNQSKDLKMDGKKVSLEKADINKVNEKTNANGSRNSVDANKQQFLSKRRSVSVSSNAYQNRDVANLSFLVKSLEAINEEQTKTIAELKRQQNTSQKPNGKTEKAQNDDLIPNVDNSNESDGNIPLDTIGLMRALSTLAVQKNTEEKDDKKDSMDKKSQSDNLQNPLPADLDNNLNPESTQNRTVVGSYSIPEETMGLLRLVSTVGENIRNNAIDREKSQKTFLETALNSKVEVPKQESNTEPVVIGHDQQHGQTQSAISEKRYRHSDDDRCTFKDVNEVYKEIKDIKIEEKRLKDQLKSYKEINVDLLAENTENVPTKDNEIEKGFNTNGRSAVMNDEGRISGASMNYSLQPNTKLLKQVKDVDKESQVEILPENLEVRENTVSSTAQREIATYRRNSGTLCFKTVPASKRSQLCQCDEQSYCEMVQNKGTQTVSEINNGSQNEQNCATGHIKCTRTLPSKNMNSQTPNTSTMSGSTGKRASKQSNEKKFGELNTQSLNNYLNSKEEAVQTDASPTRNEYNFNQRNSLGRKTSTASDQNIKGALLTLKEELERCKQLARQNNMLESGMEIHNTLETKVSEEVLSEFDAGCQLKRGQALHSVNELYLPRCVFVLHIGTVVLSDEAVLISRGKSLGLTWKFYDQDVMTTQMRAGRVVVFDFSTEYDTTLTNEFLNYMKHDELKILICQLDEPNKPIASCSLPLRDALLNTNRRADMSLALVAGPHIMYARQQNDVSDILDAGDEMGVLDLWCMLRADAQYIPLINKAISRRSEPTLLSRESNMSDCKRNEKQMDKIPTKHSKPLEKKLQQNDEFSLRRWGSSVLQLPSRQTSKESSDKIKQENDLEGQSDVNVQNCKRRDSSGFKMPDTVEIDELTPKKKLTMLHGHLKKSKTKPKKTSPRTTSAAVQHNDDQESMIIDEVFANIRTSDDMKRVMNRVSLHGEARFEESELNSFKDTEKQTAARQPGHHQSTDISNSTFLSNMVEDHNNKKTKRFETSSTLSQDTSLEPAVLFPRGSFGSKRSDMTDINRKYDNIAKLYAKYNAQKNEGARADQSKKQVKINSKRASQVQEEPKKDKPEEEEQNIDITILWLALNEECEAMLNPRVQRVYVSYEFLEYSGADLETPVSLPKPKHYVDKCYFNFKKTFQIEKDDMPVLGKMARCRATSQVSKTDKDCIVFSVISEPPEDPLGLDICEDIGYAYLYLGDLLAYGVGSPGYTEVVPVRSRSGTSVCGVLAIRLDGLDVVRRCLELVDTQIPPS